MTVERLIHRKSYEDHVRAFRRHEIVLLKRVVAWAVLAAIPPLIALFLRSQFPEILAHPVGYPALVLGASAYELGVWLLLLTMILDHDLDLWVVTNDRLVSMEQHGLFSRTVAELDLWRVQDVTTEVHGVFPTMLDYGDVHVQTAGTVSRFVLEQVPNPESVRQFILHMADIDRRFHQQDLLTAKVVG